MHYVDFKDKATRYDFWYFTLCQFLLLEGSYENPYLKDMGSYWGLYQQSGIGESGAPLAKINPYDFRRMSEDDVISWIEGL